MFRFCCSFFERNDSSNRVIHLSDCGVKNKKFKKNKISSTKYTLLSFLPKSLVEQFSLRMNQYFLLLAILQLWREVTPINPIATWTPLLMVVGVGMGKELIDDFFRLKNDIRANSKGCTVVRNGIEKKMRSSEIRVGDLVFVKENEEIRADMVLLKSSNDQGLAYVETSALDGERDYKEKRAVSFSTQLENQELFIMQGIIECEPPNADIDRFYGNMSVSYPEMTKISLSSTELLLQGTYLKNTDWVYGIVIYTGNETKIGKNKQTIQMKWTRMDTTINNATIFIFSMQILLMLILGITGDIFSFHNYHTFYLGYDRAIFPFFQPIIIPIRFLLLSSLMIPQSLKITSDICKYILSCLICWDINMYDPKTNTPTSVSNTSICEELGQIDYVFTDKTGTLTENVMEFKKCIIDCRLYEEGLQTDNLIEVQQIESAMKSADEKVIQFMRTLVLCNSVFSTKSENGTTLYRSSSPDEEALVNFAKKNGAVLEYRDYNTIRINIAGTVEEYQIMKVLDFTSKRRRMSIIVKRLGEETYAMYTKGADDVIYERIHKHSKKDAREAEKYITEFAGQGLRTLCMAMKEMTYDEYNIWEAQFNEANTALNDRDKLVDSVVGKIEKDLIFLGASAIEDALQENVPETIESLRNAGINVWMLTGDKRETAVQIGYACKLINDSTMTKVFHLTGDSLEEFYQNLSSCLSEAFIVKKYKDVCTVIEGKDLKHLLHSTPEVIKNFQKLAHLSNSVICCRMNPIQKGEIVKMMKGNWWSRKRTLGIGDGGNDVAMLLQADVGVGISGKEGLQAVRASDYGISRFKFLQRLILVHGRNCHHKLATLSQYTIYKSLIIAFTQLLFSFHSAFSGSPLLDSFVLTTYNTLFTALLPMVFIFDKQISDKAFEKLPELYTPSKSGDFFNVKTLILTFLYAMFQSLVISSITFLTFGPGHILRESGKTMDYPTIGLVVLTIIMTIQLVTVLYSVDSISIVTIIIAFGEYLLFVTVTIIFSILPWGSFKFSNEFYAPIHLMMEPLFYLVVLLAVAVSVGPPILWKSLRHYMNTTLEFRTKLSRYIFQDDVIYTRYAEKRQKKSGYNRENSDTFYFNLKRKLLGSSKGVLNSQHAETTSLLSGSSEVTLDIDSHDK